jgi:hypothetical protein
MNELTVFNNVASAYSSVSTDSVEDKKKLVNAMNNPTYKLNDFINKTINMQDIYAENVELTDSDTGELYEAVRVVILDTDGNSYQTISKGVYNSLSKIMAVMGPPTWKDGLKVEVKSITKGSGKDVRNILTLKLV